MYRRRQIINVTAHEIIIKITIDQTFCLTIVRNDQTLLKMVGHINNTCSVYIYIDFLLQYRIH